MTRAYISLNRNDLPDNLLQFVDVTPNTSRLRAGSGAGQTGYISDTVQNELPVAAGVGPFTASVDVKGLAAYLGGNVEDTGGGNLALLAADAQTIGNAIIAASMAGTALELEDINLLIVATVGAGSDLDGTLGNSTGDVEDVLAILAGAVYRIDAGTVIAGVAGAYAGGNVGDWVNDDDADYRPQRYYFQTGSLNLSALSGQLSKLQSATYEWLNPAMTYGAAGTALFMDTTHIPATGIGRAVTVYTANGELL